MEERWMGGRCVLFSRWGGPGSLCSGECCLLQWRACLCRAVLGTTVLVLDSSLMGEDRRGRFLCIMCAAGVGRFLLGGWLP